MPVVSTPVSAPARVAWPDVAKALCIVLVVERHATLFSNEVLQDGMVETIMFVITDTLRPMRIPLFFVVSGYLVARSVQRGWSGDLVDKRVLAHYWRYLLWLSITAVAFLAIPGESMADLPSWEWFAISAFVGLTPLWYLWALAVYFVITKALSRYPLVLIGIAAVLCVVGYTRILPNVGNSTPLLQNLVYFAAAALYPHLVQRVVNGASWRRAALTGVLFLAGGIAFALTALQRFPFFGPAVSVIAVVFALTVIALIADRMPRWWTYIGRNTLAIYVMHLVVIVLVASLVPQIPAALTPLYVLLLTVVAVAIPLGLHRMLRGPAPWLFDLPRRHSRIDA